MVAEEYVPEEGERKTPRMTTNGMKTSNLPEERVKSNGCTEQEGARSLQKSQKMPRTTKEMKNTTELKIHEKDSAAK